MSLKHIDMDSALRRIAERRIEEAMREGKFDNLRGMGKPLDLEPMPAEESARLTWWALRILKQNDVVPDEVRWRKSVDLLRHQLSRATNETQLSELVGKINEITAKINTLGTNAISLAMAPIDLEEELAKFRAGRSPGWASDFE